MNTVRSTTTKRSSGVRLARFMLCGLLSILLSLSLLPTTKSFAAAAQPQHPALTQNGVLEQAGVSVVRLLISYNTIHNAQISCTALGTIVASWPAISPNDRNNWVLTDSSMVALNGGACSAASQLATIQVQANNAYTNGAPPPTVIGALTCTKGTCRDAKVVGTGPTEAIITSSSAPGGTLFSFHTDNLNTQPYLNSGQASSGGTGIELANSSKQWPQSSQVGTTPLQEFLTPVYATTAPASAPSGTKVPTPPPVKQEPGMPLVDAQGNLVAMQGSNLTRPFTTTDLGTLESQVPEFQNQTTLKTQLNKNGLQTNWVAGIQAYDAGNYALAAQTLNKIQDPAVATNPDFQAARNFAQLATQKEQQGNHGNSGTSNNGSNGQGNSGSVLGIPTSTILLIGLIAGVIFLVLLLVLVSLVFGRRRTQRRQDKAELARFKEDEEQARQAAEREAQRITEESRRQPQPPLPQQLSPAESEITQPMNFSSDAPAVIGPQPPVPAPPTSILPPQPVQPPAAYAAAAPAEENAVFDAPTVPARKNGNGGPSPDGTIVRDLRNVSLAVGYQSNVGIKRQHKPNEDSLFAMQGARTHNSQPQQFGLFVVADGMGGHANGQDASRLAIQTMIDFMLPKISVGNGMMDDAAYLHLLEEGVQHANQAVHQRNLEEHADMGTTMTTALVIGPMAYVANVGDSRTYLYRPSLGLTKVTRDHSVVASLVDAGIIKPDDIYTHPKRNQIYRSLGEKPIVEVDSFKVELQPNDKLLLCSDGLWDMVRDPEIQRIISAPEPNPTKTGEDLIQAALNGGGEDNVSVIVVSISESSGHTGLTGVQLLAKPESVTVPDLPAM